MRLAIFDLDDTLLDGDCSALWNDWMVERGWVDAPGEFIAQTQQMSAAYRAGRLDLNAYLALTLAPLAGRCEQAVQAEVNAFVATRISARLFPQGRTLTASCRRAGEQLLMISASSRHLVQPVAEMLGIDQVIAVEPACRDGYFTGATTGVLSYQDGKVARLDAWLAERCPNVSHMSFYSDSRNDLPLLNRVDRPVVVNPDPVLAEVARVEGWECLNWREELRVGSESRWPAPTACG